MITIAMAYKHHRGSHGLWEPAPRAAAAATALICARERKKAWFREDVCHLPAAEIETTAVLNIMIRLLWIALLNTQGRDLNPLLQDPGFLFHPPMLYMGYVGFSVAFAFAIAALWAGRTNPSV